MDKKVKWVELGEICEFQAGLSVPSNASFFENIDGTLQPLIRIGNFKNAQFNFEDFSYINPNNFNVEDKFWLLPKEIIVARIGETAGKLAFNGTNKKFIFHSNCSKLKIFSDVSVNSKYLFFTLLVRQQEIYSLRGKGAQPYLNHSILNRLKIPLPSLEQQEKIAKWLDTFSSLERQLERHKSQYRYYLEQLMRGGQMVELKEIIKETFTGTLITKSQITSEGVPCIRYGEIYTTYDIWCEKPISHIQLEEGKKYKYCEKGDLLITKDGENISDIAKPLAYYGNTPVAIDGHTIALKHSQNSKFLAYALTANSIKSQKKKLCNNSAIIVGISAKQALRLQIPLPSLEKQQQIADWLDKFRELTNSITKGLPREIFLLQQQYKYYRERLIGQ